MIPPEDDVLVCQDVEMNIGKRQRKVKVFDSYENPHTQGTKRPRLFKKILKSKEVARKEREKEKEKEKESRAKLNKSREKRRIFYIPTPTETKVLPSVALSHINKAAQLVLSEDQMTCFGFEVCRISLSISININTWNNCEYLHLNTRVDFAWCVQHTVFIKEGISGRR